jgi:hypothetical protein
MVARGSRSLFSRLFVYKFLAVSNSILCKSKKENSEAISFLLKKTNISSSCAFTAATAYGLQLFPTFQSSKGKRSLQALLYTFAHHSGQAPEALTCCTSA